MSAKNNGFCIKQTLSSRGRLLNIPFPAIMGVINITTDSFYSGSRSAGVADAIEKAGRMIEEGAAIIDLGAMSSRPGAIFSSVEDESKRLLPVLREMRREFQKMIISVDTVHAVVARKAVEAGADIINDISAGEADAEMFSTIAELKVPYLLMHMQGVPETMQKQPQYEDVVEDVMDFFRLKVDALLQLGVSELIIDPGFGFGKTPQHNYELLKNLTYFKMLELPLLVGLSRKSMVTKVLGVNAEDALNGTSVLHTLALQNGADILRVHDVKEAAETIKIINFYNETED